MILGKKGGKVGAPVGNKNAAGKRGGVGASTGARPSSNWNAFKSGFKGTKVVESHAFANGFSNKQTNSKAMGAGYAIRKLPTNIAGGLAVGGLVALSSKYSATDGLAAGSAVTALGTGASYMKGKYKAKKAHYKGAGY